jgi:hypothetical protein
MDDLLTGVHLMEADRARGHRDGDGFKRLRKAYTVAEAWVDDHNFE